MPTNLAMIKVSLIAQLAINENRYLNTFEGIPYLKKFQQGYVSPLPTDIEKLMARHSVQELQLMMGVGKSAIHSWKSTEKSRVEIKYSAWRLFLISTGKVAPEPLIREDMEKQVKLLHMLETDPKRYINLTDKSYLKKKGEGYEPPTPEIVKQMTSSYTVNDLVISLGVKRKTYQTWITPTDKKSHKCIPYCAWRLFLVNSGIVSA